MCDDDVVAASLEARQRMRARAHLHCIGVSVTSPTQAAGFGLLSIVLVQFFFPFYYFYQASWLIGDDWAYQLESIVFFFHNKTALANLSVDFNTSQTNPKLLRHRPAGRAHISQVIPSYSLRECNSITNYINFDQL